MSLQKNLKNQPHAEGGAKRSSLWERVFKWVLGTTRRFWSDDLMVLEETKRVNRSKCNQGLGHGGEVSTGFYRTGVMWALLLVPVLLDSGLTEGVFV